MGLYVLKVQAVDRRAGPGAPAHTVQLVPFYYRANRDENSRWTTWIPYE